MSSKAIINNVRYSIKFIKNSYHVRFPSFQGLFSFQDFRVFSSGIEARLTVNMDMLNPLNLSIHIRKISDEFQGLVR